MATKFYLAEIPDDFPATNVKFENMTKPLLVVHGTHTKKNGSVNVEFKTPSRGGKKSASLKKLKIVKTSNLMHSAWTKVS